MDTSPLLHQTLTLRDGRTLGYAEAGDPHGAPLMYFSGGIGSRLQGIAMITEPAAQTLAGIRLICVDRPGLALSSFQPGRRMLDLPGDIAQLADALGIDRFAVFGVSAGGPYALACAYAIPDRLTACGVVSGALPPSLVKGIPGLIMGMYRWAPALTRLLWWFSITRHAAEGEAWVERMAAKPPRIPRNYGQQDRNFWSDPTYTRAALRDYLESMRNGTKGAAHDASLWAAPWGFEPEQIEFGPIYLWQGELDPVVPVDSARIVAARLKRCDATYYPDGGHSIIHYHFDEIVHCLAQP